jgi:hypothetical protein
MTYDELVQQAARGVHESGGQEHERGQESYQLDGSPEQDRRAGPPTQEQVMLVRRVLLRLWRYTSIMTDRQTEIVNRLRSLDAKMTVLDDQMQWVIAALGRVLTRERTVMTSITELQAKADATLARVQNETNTVNAVKAVVEHSNDMIAALRQQLTDAIAAGVDPAALQKLSDTLDAAESTDMANAQVVADAVVAGTPADPAAGGSTGGVGGTEPTGGVDEGTSAAGSDAKVTGGDGAKT